MNLLRELLAGLQAHGVGFECGLDNLLVAAGEAHLQSGRPAIQCE